MYKVIEMLLDCNCLSHMVLKVLYSIEYGKLFSIWWMHMRELSHWLLWQHCIYPNVETLTSGPLGYGLGDWFGFCRYFKSTFNIIIIFSFSALEHACFLAFAFRHLSLGFFIICSLHLTVSLSSILCLLFEILM